MIHHTTSSRRLAFGNTTTITLIITCVSIVSAAMTACQSIAIRQDVRPLVMRDVPATRLAFRLEPDTTPPAEVSTEEAVEKLEPIQADFTSRRPDDALIRTVSSPDKQRALALYNTDNDSRSAFRIDLYAADGKFLRNLTPPDLACVFPETVAWSPDGNLITFIGHRAPKPSPTPTPPPGSTVLVPEAVPSPSIAPAFPAIALFNTEQIYVCNRDGFDLKPITSREGLIYFYFSWAPDNHALVALACKEPEWDAREKEHRMPAGRPRLVNLDGTERLLDDQSTEALPVWSADSSKVATAFETDVAIYDAASQKPTQARMHLRDQLIKASAVYEEKHGGKKKDEKTGNNITPASATGETSLPASFNPIVRVEWPSPDKLYVQTAYVRLFNEPINTFQRWHLVVLSAQAAILK